MLTKGAGGKSNNLMQKNHEIMFVIYFYKYKIYYYIIKNIYINNLLQYFFQSCEILIIFISLTLMLLNKYDVEKKGYVDYLIFLRGSFCQFKRGENINNGFSKFYQIYN